MRYYYYYHYYCCYYYLGQRNSDLVGFFRFGQVNQTLYTDIMMQMQNTLEKLALGLVFELDDRFKSKMLIMSSRYRFEN